MGWPKGRLRGPRIKPPEEGAAVDAAPAPVEAQPAPVQTRAAPKVVSAPKKKTWTMAAGNNWDDGVDFNARDNPDELFISPDMIPENMVLNWKLESVYGQEYPQRMAELKKTGWTVVHPSDFDGIYEGRYSPVGSNEPIRKGGLVLMARPKWIDDKFKAKDKIAAREQVAVKEAALTGGHMEGVSGAGHPSAVGSNFIRRSMEQVEIPKE